ncbi:MAG TPA: peptidylprolyl isomerase [Steroidobacteraceae bacterium]|nr:peptidylprolyl isomerase [Steroidobacteraceae bacterium]
MNHLRTLSLAAALAALSACQPKTGTEGAAADTSPPVATVNGSPITRGFYDFYIKGITGKTPADLTAAMRTTALDNLIRAKVVADEAIKEGVEKNPDTAYTLQLAHLQVLEQAMQDKYLKDRPPTEQEVRAEYETQLGTMPKLEYHTRNILVATEPFAEKAIARLDKGEKFEDVAKSVSMDPSKSNGGDIPWTTPDRMPPAYGAAVIALKPGEYTHKPVQTQFGWHVIQLVETRDLAPPPFDQVKGRLEQVVQAKKFRAYMDELMKSAKVQKTDSAVAAAPAAGAAAPAQPAAPASASPTPPPADSGKK